MEPVPLRAGRADLKGGWRKMREHSVRIPSLNNNKNKREKQ